MIETATSEHQRQAFAEAHASSWCGASFGRALDRQEIPDAAAF